MINHNLILYSILDRKFSINAFGSNWTVNYTEGDIFELNKKLLESKTKYPIIWLQSGYKVTHNPQAKTAELKNCRIFLITKGDHNDIYKKRYETNYNDMLFPLYKRLFETFRKTSGVDVVNKEIDFVELPFNDTVELVGGQKKKPQTATVPDIWDAIVIENLNIKITEDCFPQFKI